MKKAIQVATLSLTALLACGNSARAIDTTAEKKPIVKFESGPTCKVNFLDPHSSCAESEKVIETLRAIFEAYGRHDIKTVSEYMTDDCTGFCENHKLVIGKQALIEHIQKNIEERSEDKDSPLLSYTVERPYAQVTGDTATVTFVAYKVYGGKHPRKMVSHSTDIFVKRDGKWLKSHFRNNWKDTTAACPTEHNIADRHFEPHSDTAAE